MKNKGKHTQRPWRYKGLIQDGRAVVEVGPYDEQTFHLAYIGPVSPEGFARPERDANARLIAAAPDLLEVVKMLARDYNLLDGSACDPLSTAGRVRAAIDKAEGREELK